ncbi:MAG: bifunctional metallophosphatase/5'-nucleotidase [Bacteroidota bacterium]
MKTRSLYPKWLPFLLAGALLTFSCSSSRKGLPVKQDDLIEFAILQINDVYEIAPLEGGKVGGMARVATLRKELEAQNENVFVVLAGDFLNPSLIGSLKYEGERIKGRQMVELMNAVGVDLVTFGNHEFDIKEAALQKRLNESDFAWLGTSVRHRVNGKSEKFYKEKNGKKTDVEDTYTWSIQDADGTRANIGFFGTTIASNPVDYVEYLDYTVQSEVAIKALSGKSHLILGVTHLEAEQDRALARTLEDIPLFMGGHDHDNMFLTEGKTKIAKADANAKSAYVHRGILNVETGKVTLESELITLDEKVALDRETSDLVAKWIAIQDQNIQKVVDDPYEIVYTATEPLNGLEKYIRNEPTNMCTLIAKAMRASFGTERIDLVLFNSGSVRIDDQLKGDVLAIDWFRALPFGGNLVKVELEGALLTKLLETGKDNKGTGGYLQFDQSVQRVSPEHWAFGGNPIKPQQTYVIATTGFLLSGLETGMDFFTPDNPQIKAIEAYEDKADVRSDIRKAVIRYVKSLK